MTVVIKPPHDQPWFVEVVIDTGQRLQSVTMHGKGAGELLEDMRGRLRVISAAMICETTGEAIERPSINLLASSPRRLPSGSCTVAGGQIERDVLAEALAPVE